MPIFDEEGFISSLGENEVFVFGSNGIGSHAAGAAKLAHDKFNYPIGVSTGIVGQAYGIDTMGRFENMEKDVEAFLITAKYMTNITFYVTAIGQGIAGYTKEQIEPLFSDLPSNVKKVGW